jgi:phage terminase large subunit-like protein
MGAIDETCPIVKTVNLSGGKIARAQRVSMLYEQQVTYPELELIYHLPGLEELEEELTTYEDPLPGQPKQPSPNRMDAMVYAVRELMGNGPASFHSPVNLPRIW